MTTEEYWLTVRPYFWALLIVAMFLFSIAGEI